MLNYKEKWVRASKYISLEKEDKEILKSVGIFPINDAFAPIWDKDYDILLCLGGRGSGKSEQICQLLITECANEEYFKCYFGRKVFDTVRGSCFETLVHNIKTMGLESEFHFSEANTSSMKITHKRTSNSFIPFGSDKAEKLKSIKDPTHLFCEEFDQFTLEDFKELMPTLRTERGANRFYGCFNTHNIYLDSHWIIKYFFPELYTGSDPVEFDILENMKVKKLFVNFTDNYFINQDEYYARLKLSSGGNQYVLDAIAHGAWGVTENKLPWLYAFDRSKHITNEIPFLKTFPVYLSFDFNREPVTCVAVQQSTNKGGKSSFIHFIKEFAEDKQLHELCQMIKAYFPSSILFVTGDAAGNKGDVGFEARNQTYYTIIKRYLGLSSKQIQLNSRNLEHNDSRLLMNTMFYSYPNILISSKECPKFIKDCEIAQVDETNVRPGHLKKDRAAFKLDLFDAGRYFFQTHYLEYCNKVYFIDKNN